MEKEEYRKLRDRFAAYALTAMADKVNHCLVFGGHDELAKNCYRIANALMKEKLRIEGEEEEMLRVEYEAKSKVRDENHYAQRVLESLFDKLAVDEPTHAKDGTRAKYFIRDGDKNVIRVTAWWNGFGWDCNRFSREYSLEGHKVVPEGSVPSHAERVRMYYEAVAKSEAENRKADLERRKKEFEARKAQKMAEAQAVRKPEELT